MAVTATTPGTVTRVAYERMAAQGVFDPAKRIELVDGELIVMSPQSGRHSKVVLLVAKALERAFGAGHTVRVQMPIALSDLSEPEPDLAVVPGSPDDYPDDAQPRSALLVVEVGDSSLAFDRGRKLRAYAAAGIAEYWVVNLGATPAVLEVHREPRLDQRSYARVERLERDATVQPLGARGAISLADFLR